MKTFLKVLLIVVGVLLVLKLLPVLLVIGGVGLGGVLLAGCLVLAAAGVLGTVGLGLVAALLVLAVILGVALSPIWIPVALVMGVIALVKKNQSRTAGVN